MNEQELQAVLKFRSVLRYRCLTDLYYLAKHVLDYSDLTDRLQKPLCDVIQSVNSHIIITAGSECTLNETSLGRQYIDTVKNLTLNSAKTTSGGGMGGMKKCLSPLTAATKTRLLDAGKAVISELKEEIGAEYYKFGRWASIDEEANERLFLLHRGAFKTTLVSVAHVIQLMLLWPNIRILICSHKKEGGSEPILRSVRQHFQGNEKLQALFPEFIPPKNSKGIREWGTQDAVTLVNRRGRVLAEQTVECAGLTTDVTGRHYDYIKNDDLVTQESVTNESMIQKLRAFKARQVFLFDRPETGITDNIGTIYHFNDLHNRMKGMSGITKVIMPVWDEAGVPVFYERFSAEGIRKIRDSGTMTSYDFSCQYELNPVPTEDQVFKPEWLDRLGFFYRPEEIRDLSLRIEIYVDPATTRRKQSDYTAFFIVGVDHERRKWLLEIFRDKLNVEERTNLVLEKAMQYKRHRVHYETIGFQDTDKEIIRQKALASKYHLEIIEIKASRQSKEDRIRGLQVMYERGEIRWPEKFIYYSRYHRERQDMIELLRDEMLMFPKCEHDDMLDVHSFMLRQTEYAASIKKTKIEVDEFTRLRAIIKENKESKRSAFGKKRRAQIPCIKTISRGL